MMEKIPLKTYVAAYLETLADAETPVREIDALLETLEIKKLRAFLADMSVGWSPKAKALQVAAPKLQDGTRNLALLLARDRRLKDAALLPGLVRTLAAERAGRRHAVVTAAAPLDAGCLRRISAALERIVRLPVTLEERTDASLLAGFSVQIGDWTFDTTLKSKLERLQHTLTV